MKVIIQIPCFNEADQLPATLHDLPRKLPGVDTVEWLIIDDGSTDATVEVARRLGVHHVVRLTNHKGLAAAFQAGLDACLKLRADVIVNTDADNQCRGADVPKLIQPILDGTADLVIGNRCVDTNDHFSASKKRLQRLGSAIVRRASHTDIPDVTSGFRAYNREAALQVQVVSKFTYTLETIIQAGNMLVAIDNVAVGTNPTTRESRLFPSPWAYVRRNVVAILRVYTMYEPLRVFLIAAAFVGLFRAVIWVRFLYYFATESGRGHIQSLILGATLLLMAVQLAALGVLADVLAAIRILHQRSLERIQRLELALDVKPSHYESVQEPSSPIGATSQPMTAVPTGNVYDKYGTTNRLFRGLVGAFRSDVEELLGVAAPASILDVGCGEGVLTEAWAKSGVATRIVGVDLEAPGLQAEWASRRGPNLEFRTADATALPFAAGEFDLVSGIEVLEHVPDPAATLEEMTRVAARRLLASTPREPLWRILNLLRGSYLRSFGNTPGHLNHWSKRGLTALVWRYGTIVEVRPPLPWTLALVRVH
jgi:glycosyltransferase involved in cell wall biosynthesis/2-polyprenyl-3-methyl-5-hydroxy-6-metoxy-1,4-benzoquinol methylase